MNNKDKPATVRRRRIFAAGFCLLFCLSFNDVVAENAKRNVEFASDTSAVSDTDSKGVADNDYIQPGSWQFDIYMGSFHATSPVNTEDDIDFYLLPKIRYYGERFYLENTSLGYSIVENDDWSFDLISEFNLDALNFETNNKEETNFLQFLPAGTLVFGPFGAEIPQISDRHYSYMAGIRSQWLLSENWQLSFQLSKDVSAVHGGKEAKLALAFSEAIGPYQISTQLGVDIKDAALSDYYYGLHEIEIGNYFYLPYRIDHWTYNPNFTFSIERQLSGKWSVYGYFRLQQFDSDISDSVLISDPETYWHFIGVKYRL